MGSWSQQFRSDEPMKMKTNELKVNRMEQVTGGDFPDNAKDRLKQNFPDPLEPNRKIVFGQDDKIAEKC